MREASFGARLTWHRLVWMAPVALGVLFLLTMVIVERGFEPFLFVMALIVLIAGYVGRRFPTRVGPIVVGVVLLLLVLMNLQSAISDLGHPDSFLNFAVFAVGALLLAIVGIVASIAALASRADAAAPMVAYSAIALIVVGVVVSAIATLGVEDDVAAPGDLRVTAEDTTFTPTEISGAGGTVGVFIENKDPFRHTFTIDELNIEIDLPAGTARRVEVTGAPGEYEFRCTIPGHDDMMGTLTIGS